MPISRSAQRQGFISLFGEDGDDLLQGGAGNDALRGGQGTDAIDGEAGEDRFSEPGNTNIVINGFVVTSTLLGTDTDDNDPLDSRSTLEANEMAMAASLASTRDARQRGGTVTSDGFTMRTPRRNWSGNWDHA